MSAKRMARVAGLDHIVPRCARFDATTVLRVHVPGASRMPGEALRR